MTSGPLDHLSAEDLAAAKKRFAALLLKTPDNAWAAAAAVFPKPGEAVYAAHHWPNDPEVLAEQNMLLESSAKGELDFVPTKADAARAAWKLANESPYPEDRLKAIKLFSEILGYIQKPEPIKVEQNVTNNNRVMAYRDHGEDAEWERKLREQQSKLTSQVASNAKH